MSGEERSEFVRQGEMEGRGEEVNLGRKGGRPVDPTSPSLPSSTGNAALPPSLLPLKRITIQIPVILAAVTMVRNFSVIDLDFE